MKIFLFGVLLSQNLWRIEADVAGDLTGWFDDVTSGNASQASGDASEKWTFPKSDGDGRPSFPKDQTKFVPPLTRYYHELDAWLKAMTPQWSVAVVAGVFGAVNVWNGPDSFKSMVVLGCSLLLAGIARYEFLLLWPELNFIQQIVVAAEVGLVTAYVLHKSFLGTKIILGVAFGIAVAMEIDQWTHTESWPVNACVIWYSVFGFLGIAAFTVGQRYVLAIFTPALGGFLCASALCYLVKLWVSNSVSTTSPPGWVDLRGAVWLDFASELLGGEHAGIFKPYATPGFPFSSIDFDKLLGRFLWLALFIVGMKRQWNLAKVTTASQWESLKETIRGKKPADQILLNNQYP